MKDFLDIIEDNLPIVGAIIGSILAYFIMSWITSPISASIEGGDLVFMRFIEVIVVIMGAVVGASIGEEL